MRARDWQLTAAATIAAARAEQARLRMGPPAPVWCDRCGESVLACTHLVRD